jgi:hypothetical protein
MGWLSGYIEKFKKKSAPPLPPTQKLAPPMPKCKPASELGTEVTPAPLSHPTFGTETILAPVNPQSHPTLFNGVELGLRESIPVELIPMDKYTAVLSSKQLRNTKVVGVNCPYCEVEGHRGENVFVAYDDAEFINHCVRDHHKTVDDAKSTCFFLRYLSFKGLI